MSTNEQSCKQYDPTIEESYRKQVEVDGKSYMLEILDTAGTVRSCFTHSFPFPNSFIITTQQEQFTAMRDLYMKNGQGFALVYSIVSDSTFHDLKTIRNHIIKVKDADPSKPVPMVSMPCCHKILFFSVFFRMQLNV